VLIDTSDYGVYIATRNDTGEVIYVGCSWKGMNKRLRSHVNNLKANRHENSGLQRFWNSKGLTFTHVVKCLPIKKLVLAFEKAYGSQYDFKKLVNVNPLGLAAPDISGEKHHMYGKHHSKETRKKQSTIRKRKIGLGEIVIWNKGKKCPQFSGKNHGMYGKKHSKETRKKQSEAHMGVEPWNKGLECPEVSERKKGENHHGAILTERKVQDIKYMLLTMLYRGAPVDIASIYGVKPILIYNIKSGKSWSHVKVRGWDC
jgi:hypothetical protein